jgi:hypothetical protein
MACGLPALGPVERSAAKSWPFQTTACVCERKLRHANEFFLITKIELCSSFEVINNMRNQEAKMCVVSDEPGKVKLTFK